MYETYQSEEELSWGHIWGGLDCKSSTSFLLLHAPSADSPIMGKSLVFSLPFFFFSMAVSLTSPEGTARFLLLLFFVDVSTAVSPVTAILGLYLKPFFLSFLRFSRASLIFCLICSPRRRQFSILFLYILSYSRLASLRFKHSIIQAGMSHPISSMISQTHCANPMESTITTRET